ncbi:fungal specific transcription factor domain-containing protein [Colletotrichum tabaci]|uniref:Fungal specific transcription factor domain-containing protein n=1 Tax=Colletotrichum tabaci TaxID=1209068 RepID=A0AAV9T3Q5_9PEZI
MSNSEVKGEYEAIGLLVILRLDLGPSSNIAFTKILRRTLDHLLLKTQRARQGVASSTPGQHAQKHILAVSRSSSPVIDSFDSRRLEKPSEASRLPPEDEVTRLVRQFFGDTGLLFPYIHEESFWKTFAHYRSIGMRNARYSWLALLNMILALATSTTNAAGLGLGDRQAVSEVHYRRAKSLSMTEMMTGANVEAVQGMLLMSQYLQGSQRSVQTWAIHGLAVKAALELGFHSEIALQRTLSMTFGRPPIIPQHYIRTPLPKHLISYPRTSDSFEWSREEESTVFWNATITLYRVTAAVIDDLYESTAARFEEILKRAISCIARLDTQNPTVEKCAKFVATLVFMVQSLQMGRDDIGCDVGEISSSAGVLIDENGASQATHLPPHAGGMDEAFSNLMSYLPPNFNDFSINSAPFAMSDLMDDFPTGDLFW